MEKFQAILKFASKQTNFGYGLVALITACGEQIFSSVAFKCPCNELNFIYGLVFLLMPALALLLLGIILSKKTWKLTTGFCHRNSKLCNWRNLKSMGVTVFQISASALVAPSTWIAVALLHGSYYECAMTGANSTSYTEVVCRGVNFEAKCVTELQTFPCRNTGNEIEEILRTVRAHSQILGWLVIASIMISNLLMICVAHCFSPISYLQLKFWKNYTEEENDLMNNYSTQNLILGWLVIASIMISNLLMICVAHCFSPISYLQLKLQILGWLVIASIMISNLLMICVAHCFSPISYLQLKFWKNYTEEENDLMNNYSIKHAKELAKRNLTSFFNQTLPAKIVTPCNKDWEKISSLYKFSTKDHFYSTLHGYIENKDKTEGCMRLASMRSNEFANNPPVLDVEDGGTAAL
ncbi:calcium homeostasis modulator protein 6 [Oryzias latipes]